MTAADLLEHLRTLRRQPPASAAERGEAAHQVFLGANAALEDALKAKTEAEARRLGQLADGLSALAEDLLEGHEVDLETVLMLEDMLRTPEARARRVRVVQRIGAADYAVDLDADRTVSISRFDGAGFTDATRLDRGCWSAAGHIVEVGGSAFVGDAVYGTLELALRLAEGLGVGGVGSARLGADDAPEHVSGPLARALASLDSIEVADLAELVAGARAKVPVTMARMERDGLVEFVEETRTGATIYRATSKGRAVHAARATADAPEHIGDVLRRTMGGAT